MCALWWPSHIAIVATHASKLPQILSRLLVVSVNVVDTVNIKAALMAMCF